jgi:hypothetical protein
MNKTAIMTRRSRLKVLVSLWPLSNVEQDTSEVPLVSVNGAWKIIQDHEHRFPLQILYVSFFWKGRWVFNLDSQTLAGLDSGYYYELVFQLSGDRWEFLYGDCYDY